jgi:hypothetical protein
MNDLRILQLIQDAGRVATEVKPFLDKQASCRLRATEVADILVKHHQITIEKRAEVERELQDPEFAYDMIIKLASNSRPVSLGETTEVKPLGVNPGNNLINWIMS